MIKIVVTGVECSGKTTLAKDLSSIYKAPLVSEFSRDYLNKQDGFYREEDLLIIARGQYEAQLAHKDAALVICDTDLLVLKVWSQVKYNRVHDEILDLLQKSLPTMYLLPHWDIPYEADPLREHPSMRKELFDIYVSELEQLDIPWKSVKGSPEERVNQAMKTIDPLIRVKS